MKKDSNQNTPLAGTAGDGGKEIPILFSTPMVQAIMDGRKTITRRIIKPQPIEHHPGRVMWNHKKSFANTTIEEFGKDPLNAVIDFCPYGKPGDILWIRESFSWDWKDYPERTEKYYYYKASTPNDFLASGEHWKPSIHMPKAACRIWLQVTKVRAERLQDIDHEDAMCEGVHIHADRSGTSYHWDEKALYHSWWVSAEYAFADLWKKINGHESWDANPWVWVIEFKILSTTGKPSIIHNS